MIPREEKERDDMLRPRTWQAFTPSKSKTKVVAGEARAPWHPVHRRGGPPAGEVALGPGHPHPGGPRHPEEGQAAGGEAAVNAFKHSITLNCLVFISINFV